MQLITSLLIAQNLLFSVNTPVPSFDKEIIEPLKISRLEAIKKAEVVIVTPAPVKSLRTPQNAPQSVPNDYKLFIYMKESGNNPAAVNASGCRGLGQACPGSKLPCGNDYACQDAWFTNYAISRYGSWENAYLFWLGHNWW